MKVLFLLESRKTPSSRFRAYNYSRFLKEAGIKFTNIAIPKNFLARLFIFLPIPFYDLVFIQKKIFHIWELAIIRALALKIVYDIDDAIMFMDKPAEEGGLRRIRTVGKNKRFYRTLNTVDYVIAGNRYLVDVIRKHNTNITIIPTPVDTKSYTVIDGKREEGKIVIGWIGTEGNLKYLNMLEGVLGRLQKKYSHIELKIVCDQFVDLNNVIHIEKKLWKLEDEIKDLQSFDIGIMPLTDNVWTRGKCGFKILQYMAVGVPSVSSPVGVNSEIVADGVNGFLAKDEDEWIEKLSLLIENKDLRKKIGRKGREFVEENYSLDSMFIKFKGVLESVFSNRYKIDKKPNILHTENSNGWGGQEMRILLEAEEFSKRGYKVLLACYPGGGLMKNAEKKGIRTVPVMSNFLSLYRIRQLIKHEKIDIVNTHSSKDSWAASFATRMSLGKRPLLIRTRHLSVPISTHLFNFIYKMPDMIITTCESTREELIKTNKIGRDQVLSIPTGVRLEKYDVSKSDTLSARETLGIDNHCPIISMIAVLRSWKRHDVFVDAAKKVVQEVPEVKFLIVGEGPQEENIEKKIKRLNLSDNVMMTGYREDVPDILAVTDISVLVSDSAEGVPQIVVQSLAMRKPVIGTNVGGIPELVRNGETGILIEPNNPDMLADKVLFLIKNREFAKKLGEAGRRLVEEEFTSEIMVNKLEQLYKRHSYIYE